MPDICFHFSSQRAHENGLTSGDDKTRISMPIEPAIQIPNTAKPTCYLHNMAFSNNIANVNVADGSNQITLSTGSSACKFHQGTTHKPWIGIKYKRKVGSTLEDFQLIAPLTVAGDNKLSVHGADGDQAWKGQVATLDGMTVAQVYTVINNCFQQALGGANSGYIAASFQGKVVTDDGGTRVPTAAFTVGGKETAFPVQIPGSSANGLISYASTGTAPGSAVAIDASLVNSKAEPLLTSQEFEFMTSTEINDHINAAFDTTATYSIAKSVFDGLGGGPTGATGSNLTFADRNSLGGNATVYESPVTAFGLYQDDIVSTTVSLDIDAYELADFELAIAKGAKADTAFWAKVTSHLPTTKPPTVLVNPDVRTAKYKKQVAAAESGDPLGGSTYVKLLDLQPDVGADRIIATCAPNIEITGGALPTRVFGFDATQLGFTTEGPKQVKAQHAARIDRTRAILFHAPTIAAGSYSTEGKQGGSAIAMIPIDSAVGDTQSWECAVPVHVPARIAGTSLSHITVFLSNEDGEKLSLMGDRWSAQLILSF